LEFICDLNFGAWVFGFFRWLTSYKVMNMMSNIWFQRGLPTPPHNFDDTFFDWLWKVGRQLDVTFFDTSPVPSTDFDELKRTLVSLK
jgi:hypothetical protein